MVSELSDSVWSSCSRRVCVCLQTLEVGHLFTFLARQLAKHGQHNLNITSKIFDKVSLSLSDQVVEQLSQVGYTRNRQRRQQLYMAV